MLLMVNITRYHSKLYVRKLSFLSFCRFAETDKNDNFDKTDIIHHCIFQVGNRHYRKNRYNRIVIGYRCATDGIVMSSYEPVKNPL
jgi:hypothetical protein